MYRLGSAVAAVLLACGVAHAGTLASAALPLGYEDALTDTFIIWGDTQHMTNDGTAPCADGTRCDDLEKAADWVCAHKTDDNIKAVLGVGDIVNLASESAEWANFMNAHAKLVACDVPYIPTLGNHEIDTGAGVANASDTQGSAENYWTNLGVPLDSEPWFGGRGNYVEVYSRLSAAPGAALYTETNNTGSRSFWVRLGSRFAVMSAEWELSARLSDRAAGYDVCVDETETWSWALGVMEDHPDLIWFHLTHAGPCDPDAGGCDDWTNTDDGECGERHDWKRYRDAVDNALVYIHGHSNEQNCSNGGGKFVNVMRDSGVPALTGMYDFNCATRAYDGFVGDAGTSPYGWQGRLLWKRGTRQVCLQTMRGIKADVSPATLVYPPDLDRTDNSNTAETCVSVVLPEALR